MSNPEDSGANFIVEFVLSKDGTRIGYRKCGNGPAVILVQGAMGATRSYHGLAGNLARDFTVFVPERRGRLSSPREYSPDHVIERELEDLEAVFERSGAHLLFGLSSGAVLRSNLLGARCGCRPFELGEVMIALLKRAAASETFDTD